VVEPSARFEQVKVPLPEPVNGLEHTSAVVGIPEWWPTGSRIAAVIAHDVASTMDDPLIIRLQEGLTQREILTLRFNFPFADTGKPDSIDSMEVLHRCYEAAVSLLIHGPAATPSRLLVGGKGLGAKVAASVASSRTSVEAAFFLGFPLHPLDRSDAIQADLLYRITSPMLFIQGTRDRRCDVNALRDTLRRVGAPTVLKICANADHGFRLPDDATRTNQELESEVLHVLLRWVEELVSER
jgi:predicted alpha/beta-hydrolase family hydrolase